MAVVGWNPAEYTMHQQSRRDDMMRNLLNMFLQKKQFDVQDRWYQDQLSQQQKSNELAEKKYKLDTEEAQGRIKYYEAQADRWKNPAPEKKSVYELQRDDLIGSGIDKLTASLNAAGLKTKEQIYSEARSRAQAVFDVTGGTNQKPSSYVNPTVRRVSTALETFSKSYIAGKSSGSLDPYDASQDPMVKLLSRLQEGLIQDWTNPELPKEKETAYASLINIPTLRDISIATGGGNAGQVEAAKKRLIGKYGLLEDNSLNIPGFEGVFVFTK